LLFGWQNRHPAPNSEQDFTPNKNQADNLRNFIDGRSDNPEEATQPQKIDLGTLKYDKA
jgi:hypothetical protein